MFPPVSSPSFPNSPPRRGLGVAASAQAGGPAAEGPRPDDALALFAFADRRRRTLKPQARDLLLRAQAARACGRLEAAQRDLEAALALVPGDLALDLAALAWGAAPEKKAAAMRIAARTDADPRSRARAAAQWLETEAAAQSWRRTPDGVAGWLAWRGPAPLAVEFQIDGKSETFEVEPDPGHPLAGPGVSAAQVKIECPAQSAVVVAPQVEGAAAQSLPAWATEGPSPAATAPREVDLTVIVPVYDDLAATRACLEALRASPPACRGRIVVVDDAAPDANIRRLLDEAAAAGVIDLIRNPSNLGYAASVNRALATRAGGDVLLLNADALPPPGALDRLRALSRSAPDVGTITPFSNNGELTSYPERFAANPLPDAAEIAALDARARAVNGDALVDLPNGVGFCLYITAACADAVGKLPEIYGLGYYEDVEFCLAARERGFRNVAAPGVYVGHAGARSFGARKAALVARNLPLLEARYPGCELETAAFVSLDPLAPFRAALDRAAPPSGPVALVASGPGAAARLAQKRAHELSLQRPETAVLTLVADARGRLSLARAGAGAPQSLVFDDAAPCVAWLDALDLKLIECFDPASLPAPVLDALIAREAAFEAACGDLGWFASVPAPPEGPCASPAGEGPCEGCRALAAARAEAGAEARRARLGRALERAAQIAPLDRLAEGFARRVFKSRVGPFAADPPPPPPAGRTKTRLGVLYSQRSAAVDRLLLRWGRREAGRAEIVVFGETLDDRALMATGRIFVTGPIAPPEVEEAARAYGVEALLGLERSGGFGELEALAGALAIPKVYFDWSFGALQTAPGDLSLDPRICDDKAAARIDAWADEEGPASP